MKKDSRAEPAFSADRCVAMLREKQEEILAGGGDRYPRRSDFSDEQTAAIKAFLGPWPRALEAAGLKPPPAKTSAERNRERRIRAKRRRRAEEKAGKAAPDGDSTNNKNK